jgi:sterol desaturase/sphingolipid hydroxylase (fatty acid hydroxylase superfamily)
LLDSTRNNLTAFTIFVNQLRRNMYQFCTRCLLASLFALTLLISPAWAQKKQEPVKAEPKSYVLQYTLSVLLISLGVYVAIKPGNRAATLKRQTEDEE